MSFLVGPLDELVRLVHIAAVIAWVGLLHFLAFIRPRITDPLGEGTRKEVLPHMAAQSIPWVSWGALIALLAGVVLYLDRIIRASWGEVAMELHIGSVLGLVMVGLTHALVLPGLRRLAAVKDGAAPPPSGLTGRTLTASRWTAFLSWVVLALMVVGAH